MRLPVLLKDILLDYDRLTVRTKSIVYILWYLRQLHATSGLRKVFVCQIINRLHLLQLQCSISVQRIALIIGFLLRNIIKAMILDYRHRLQVTLCIFVGNKLITSLSLCIIHCNGVTILCSEPITFRFEQLVGWYLNICSLGIVCVIAFGV